MYFHPTDKDFGIFNLCHGLKMCKTLPNCSTYYIRLIVICVRSIITISCTQITYCGNGNRRSSPVYYARESNSCSIIQWSSTKFPGAGENVRPSEELMPRHVINYQSVARINTIIVPSHVQIFSLALTYSISQPIISKSAH